MSIIVKQDTNGVKPLLQVGELGYDNFLAGGDAGRVYVGTGTENIALASRQEVQEVFDDTNLLRADKYLAAQDVANMEYNAASKPTKVQYNSSTDIDYEVFTYNENNKLINVAHYVDGILKGNTVLSYSNGKLVSAPFTEA